MYDRPPAEVQVTVPRRVGLRPYPGVIVRRRDVDVADLGASGTAAVSQLLTAAADRADSTAERLMIGLLREAGVTGWEHGMPFGR